MTDLHSFHCAGLRHMNKYGYKMSQSHFIPKEVDLLKHTCPLYPHFQRGGTLSTGRETAKASLLWWVQCPLGCMSCNLSAAASLCCLLFQQFMVPGKQLLGSLVYSERPKTMQCVSRLQLWFLPLCSWE